MKRLFILLILCVSLFAGLPASADLDDGLYAYDKKDYKTALREFKPLAEEGDSDAQFYLGAIYANGFGVPQDSKEAAKWYTLSAAQGDDAAQFNLGLLYVNGEGVPQDYKESVKWWRLSAEQGYAKAQNSLGVMYDSGQGVPQDYILSHMWHNLAASNGYEQAAEYRDDTAKRLTPQQITKAQEMARECLAKDYKGC